jgi:hypothetical protein
LGDFDRLGIVGCEGAVLQAGAQKIDDGQSQALLALCWGLDVIVSSM